jgi:hypothetical protein
MASEEMACDWGHCTRVILNGEMCMYSDGGVVVWVAMGEGRGSG